MIVTGCVERRIHGLLTCDGWTVARFLDIVAATRHRKAIIDIGRSSLASSILALIMMLLSIKVERGAHDLVGIHG
jgi:hypothetical protein